MVRIRPASSWATADISMVTKRPIAPGICGRSTKLASLARNSPSDSQPRKSSYRSQTRINSTDVLVIKNSGDGHQAVREPSSSSN
jgi:hypothetical protein